MFFSLLISFLFWQVAQASSPEERAAEQKAIEAECKPLLSAGQAIYDSCIAEGGQKAQMELQKERANEKESVSKPPVCNPSGALSACDAASDHAAKMNNPSASDHDVQEAIVSCRSACNPKSAQVLSQYLGGCGASAKAQVKQMNVYLNKCGYKVSAKDEESEEKSLTDKFMNLLPSKDELVGLLPSKAKAIAFESGWIGGKSESTVNSFANVYSVPLSEDIDYVKTTARDGSVSYMYRSTDGSLHDSYANAESVNLSLSGPRGRVPVPMPSLPKAPNDGSSFADTDPTSEVPATLNAEARTSVTPDDFRAPPGEGRKETTVGGGNGGETSGGGNGGGPAKDPVVRQPAPSPQPIVAENDGAFVNNALNSPPPNSSGGGMSPVSVGDSSEISSGGGSSSSAGYSGVGGGGSSSRGNFQGSGQQPSPPINDSPELRPANGGGGIAADTNLNGNMATGGRGSAPVGDVAGGRMMASAARTPPATLDGFGSQGVKNDSNNFYKTPGKTGAAPSRARLVKVDPNCKGKNCKWKQVPVSGNSAGVSCDGNPQCLVSKTGLLNAKKIKALDDYWKNQKSGAKSADRGVAGHKESPMKMVSTPKCVIEGTCWQGLDAVLLHKKVIDECFQLDHAGDLQVNRSGGLQSKCDNL